MKHIVQERLRGCHGLGVIQYSAEGPVFWKTLITGRTCQPGEQMIVRLRPVLKYFPVLAFISITLYLRLANLGYSDYLADEVLALIRLAPGQTLLDLILSKPRGPLQYIITYLIGLVRPRLCEYLFDPPALCPGRQSWASSPSTR